MFTRKYIFGIARIAGILPQQAKTGLAGVPDCQRMAIETRPQMSAR